MLYNKIIIILLSLSHLHYPNIKQIKCIQQTIYFEAAPTSKRQSEMIARVIMNRTVSNQFPSTPCDVISQAGQFESFMGFGMHPRNNSRYSEKIWNRDFVISYMTYVFNDWLRKKYDYVLYFHTRNITEYSQWEYNKIYIGNQVFFRK